MVKYLFYLTGGLADNDFTLLKEKKHEILKTWDLILEGCFIEKYRLEALTYKAKVLYAMNDEEGALAILNQFPSFYQSSNQRIEQLYPKDTNQFYHQLTNNMFELSSFCVNKLGKQIWFNKKLSIEQNEKKINKYYDLFKTIDCNEDYNVVAVFFKNLFSKLLYREKDHNLNRILKQYEKEAIDLLDDIAKEDSVLKAYLNN